MSGETKQERRVRELKKCKHFNGIAHDKCRAGVDYRTVRDDKSRPYRWACLDDGTDIPCALREYPTVEELDAQDKEIGQMISNMFVARKAITDITKGQRNTEGAIDCPICKVGSIGYTVAFNGHVHARCTTPDCVSWLE